MARSVRIELLLDTLRAVRGARELNKATDLVADSLADTAREGDRAGRAVDDAGDEMSDTARAAAALDRQVEKLTGSLREMAVQSALVGDVDIAKKMREQERQLRQVTRQRKLVDDRDADKMGIDLGARVGVSTANGMFASLSAGFKAPPPQLYAGAALLAAAIAPTLGAGIAGAVVGGVGVGGLVGGMAIAARDPRVKAEGAAFGHFLLADLERRADGFVAPMIHGMHRVEAEWLSLGPDLDRVFSASRFIDPMIDGVMMGVRRVVAGAADAVDAAGPVMGAFSRMIGGIGDAVGDSFSLFAQDAEAGASAIDDLTIAAEGFIHTTAGIVHGLAVAKGGLDDFDKWIDGVRYSMEDLSPLLDLTADGFKKGSAEAEAYRRKTLGTATAADEALLRQAELAKGLGGAGSAAAQAGLDMKLMESRLGSAKSATERLKGAQDALEATFTDVGVAAGGAKDRADALRKTQDLLYGSTARNADGNQSYEESWDQLSESVKKSKRTLDIHTAAGRSNRSTLVGLLKSNNDLYFANIEVGESTASATKKHQARTEAIRKEAIRLGLNKNATDTLIKTYGRIPPKKTTDLVLRSVDNVADALLDLATIQLHLAKGTPISASLKRRLARAQYGMPDTKRAYGGPLPGTAPHDRADNMVYAGTPGEWVIQKPTVRKVERQHGAGAMDYFNKYGELPLEGHAFGGLLRASRASWGGSGMNYRVTAGMTKVPTLDRVIAAVPVMMGGNWPSSPSAQRGDSGVWRSIVRMIRATGPMSGHFGNAYRPGDPKWHGSGRAVDWMGFNQDRLASFLAARNPLELIHRTRNRDYAYTRGRNKGSFNNSLMQAHRNHIHIAMANGGVIREPVYGYGLHSGNTYGFAERGPERVTPVSQAGGPAASPADLARAVAAALRGVSVVMDGRIVGQIQGRDTNLLARTG